MHIEEGGGLSPSFLYLSDFPIKNHSVRQVVAVHFILWSDLPECPKCEGEISRSLNKRPKGPLSLIWEQWKHKKFDFRMEPKTTTLHLTCFKIIAMYLVCCCSLLVWKKFFEEGDPPWPIFCPALDPPLCRYGRNTLMHVRGHEHLIPGLLWFINIHHAVLKLRLIIRHRESFYNLPDIFVLL